MGQHNCTKEKELSNIKKRVNKLENRMAKAETNIESVNEFMSDLKADVEEILHKLSDFNRELGVHSTESSSEDNRIDEKVEKVEERLEQKIEEKEIWPADWRAILIFLLSILSIGFLAGISVQEISIDEIVQWLFTT